MWVCYPITFKGPILKGRDEAQPDRGMGVSRAVLESCRRPVGAQLIQHLLEVLKEAVLDLLILGAFVTCLLYARHSSGPFTWSSSLIFTTHPGCHVPKARPKCLWDMHVKKKEVAVPARRERACEGRQCCWSSKSPADSWPPVSACYSCYSVASLLRVLPTSTSACLVPVWSAPHPSLSSPLWLRAASTNDTGCSMPRPLRAPDVRGQATPGQALVRFYLQVLYCQRCHRHCDLWVLFLHLFIYLFK